MSGEMGRGSKPPRGCGGMSRASGVSGRDRRFGLSGGEDQREESGGVALLPLHPVSARVAAPGNDRTPQPGKEGGERGRALLPHFNQHLGCGSKGLTERFGSMNIDISHRFRQSNSELNGSVTKILAKAFRAVTPRSLAWPVVGTKATRVASLPWPRCKALRGPSMRLRAGWAMTENEDMTKRRAG